MINFLITKWIYTIPITVSIISLILSLVNLISNRKRLDVQIEDKLEDINNIYLSVIDYKNNNPSINWGVGKVCFIKVVNPSPKDIAFFDLRVVDKKLIKQVPFIYEAQLDLINTKPNQTLFYDTNGNLARLNYPKANYGVFKSNSFTRLDIAFFPMAINSEILISFKVAISSILPNKESSYRKKFKYYKRVFKVTL